MEIKIIYEDKDILVVLKPPKVPSQPDKTGDEDMLGFAQKHTGISDIGLIHRLDRPVGGIMVLGKTKASTEYLNKSVAENLIKKTYYAVVCGIPEKANGEIVSYLLKNQKLNISKAVAEGTKGAKKAMLNFEVLQNTYDEKYGNLSLVKINLLTGRHHQIRVQFAEIKLPLWGDNKYNETFIKNKGWTQIALWAGGLEFKHPVTKENMVFNETPQGGIFEIFGNYI